MVGRRSPWHDGRRAWMRLNGWHQSNPNATPGHPDDGTAALRALGDVRFVRSTLELAERHAVQTARRHGRTWAQIADALGVKKKAIKSRWQELLDEPEEPAGAGQDS
jgi:hypothetical protein